MCRAVLAERFPDHDILAEELSSGSRRSRARRATAGCSIRSTARRTTRTACRSSARRSALEIDGRTRGRRRLRPDPRASCSPPSAAQGAYLNGQRLQVSAAGDADRRAARHRVSLRRAQADRRSGRRCSARFSAGRAPCGGWGRRRSTSATSRRDASRLLGTASQAVGRRGRRADREEAGGRVTGMDGSPFDPPRRTSSPRTAASTTRCSTSSASSAQRARNRTN